MMLVLFIVGPPASGKTQLASALLSRVHWETVLYPKWTVGDDVCAIGHYTGDQFEGGDTVPYHKGAEHFAYWEDRLARKTLTIIEGNRFCSAKYPAFCEEIGAQVACIYLDAPEQVCDERRKQRGSKLNPGWMAGRRKMAFRFWETFAPLDRLKLNGTRDRGDIVRDTIEFLRDLGCTASLVCDQVGIEAG